MTTMITTSDTSTSTSVKPSSRGCPHDRFMATPIALERDAHDAQDAGAEDDHEQSREKAEHRREEQLDRYLLGLLLGPLAAPQPHLPGLLAQHRRHRYAQLAGL